MQLKVLAIVALAIVVVVGALFATYTFWLSPSSIAQDRAIGASVTVSGNVPRSINAEATNTPGAPFTTVKPLSPVIEITPVGKLPSVITLRFKLSRQLQENEAALVATSETNRGPWTLVPSSLSKDGWYVTVQTDHLSSWQVWWYNVKQGLNEFKKVLIDGLSGDATTQAEPPSCNKDDETAARQDDYTIASSAKNTLYWCFSLEGGVRVLKVVNHMRYPLEVAHPGFVVKHMKHFNPLEADQYARLVSGSGSILYPFDEAEYTVDLAPGHKAELATQYSGLAQSLYALETGVVALVNTLSLFGFEEEDIAEAALDGNRFAKILQLSDKFLLAKDCTDAVVSFNLGQVIAKCLSAKQILDDFGWQGLFLVPLVILGPFVEFFRSEFDAFFGLLKNQDKYLIIVSRFALSPYIGKWGHHDYGLTINADGTGTDDEYFGFSPECGDTPASRHGTLQFTPESGDAIGAYTSVTYNSCLTSDLHTINVGDSFKLTPEPYDRLLLTWLGTPPTDFGGSTLWLCGPNTPFDVNIDGVCGA